MTTDIAATVPGADAPDVLELLERRARLQQWLERLDQVRADSDPRIVERVRDDYQDRLLRVMDELVGHLDALQDERARRRDALAAAEAQRQQALDALEEARLRHLIGEVQEDDWETQRPELEAEVEAGEASWQEAWIEAERLDGIVAQIEASLATPQLAAEPLIPSRPAETAPDGPGAREEDGVAFLSPLPQIAEAEPAAEPDAGEDGLAFLEELDRAIAATGEETLEQPEPTAATTPAAAETVARLAMGAKCPECGYTNDAEAWYCGVCGVDLA